MFTFLGEVVLDGHFAELVVHSSSIAWADNPVKLLFRFCVDEPLLTDLQVGPPTASPLCGHWCTVGVLAGTHQCTLLCPGRLASGAERQPFSAALN